MKKVLVILAAVSLLFAMSSCKKTCKCTATVAGFSKEMEVNLDDYKDKDSSIKKCSDLNQGNFANLVGFECK